MARWTSVITTAGQGLIAAAAGKTFHFTKAQCGSGTVDSSALEAQTAVTGFQKTLSITAISGLNNVMKLRLQLNNTSVTTGFSLYQIGIFAQLDTNVEVLFQLIQADTPDSIPSAADSPNYVNDYIVNTTVANASSITATIDSAAYATVGMVTDASTTVKGMVQLSSVTDSTSEALAATPAAVKLAYDAAAAVQTIAANSASTASTAQSTADSAASSLASHTADTVIHVTADNKTAWNSKAAGDHTHSGVYEPVDADIMRKDVAQTMTAALVAGGTQTEDAEQVRNIVILAAGTTDFSGVDNNTLIFVKEA